MKKFFIRLALVCAVMALACTGAFAAISNITVDSSGAVTMEAIGDAAVRVTVTGVPEGTEVLEVTLSTELTGTAKPTAENIVHIEQGTSGANGVVFTVYPAEENLVSGATYYVYLSSNATEGPITDLAKVGSFVYGSASVTPTPVPTSAPTPVPTPGPGSVLYGDANNSGNVDVSDAMAIVNYIARRINASDINMEAADANGSGNVDVSDAMAIVNYIARRITVLGPQR